ncbi:hypothetical protein KP79_PYT03308 [Mizuhopecten yessoensis]|uniref:Uncharacterized protein n=1 Tax=Mizuhopecten yessoensis TaxID=6573 RepID=A0A210PGS6_MIZYE|nr:hypothetical protein KP79_PYT03308 [Mizuhopecten yessoensis]
MASVSITNILKYSSLNRLILSPGRVFGARTLPALTSSRATQRRQFSSSVEAHHKVLFDGKCPLCVKDDLLRKFNRGSVDFVDITDGTYTPADHQGAACHITRQTGVCWDGGNS